MSFRHLVVSSCANPFLEICYCTATASGAMTSTKRSRFYGSQLPGISQHRVLSIVIYGSLSTYSSLLSLFLVPPHRPQKCTTSTFFTQPFWPAASSMAPSLFEQAPRSSSPKCRASHSAQARRPHTAVSPPCLRYAYFYNESIIPH